MNVCRLWLTIRAMINSKLFDERHLAILLPVIAFQGLLYKCFKPISHSLYLSFLIAQSQHSKNV